MMLNTAKICRYLRDIVNILNLLTLGWVKVKCKYADRMCKQYFHLLLEKGVKKALEFTNDRPKSKFCRMLAFGDPDISQKISLLLCGKVKIHYNVMRSNTM